MEKDIAEILVEELSKHERAFPVDKKFFMGTLTKADVPDSSRFYEELPYEAQSVDDQEIMHSLSLRRVLRNRNAEDYQLSPFKRAFEAVTSAFNIYSSDVLSRSMRSDKDIVRLMSECSQPYSLLAKFRSYDYSDHENPKIEVSPVLIIPGADRTAIDRWEDSNTQYLREAVLLGCIPVCMKITERKFLAD